MTRVAFVTCAPLPEIAADDRLAAGRLRAEGIAVEAAPWNDPGVRWEEFGLVVLRSCWDYHRHPEEFAAWLDGLEAAGARVCNPLETVRWNADKRYLRELEERGCPVVPTRWVERGSRVPLATVLEEEGWRRAVVKPRVSASARGTWRTGLDEAAGHEARFREQAAAEAVMVQPFLEEVETEGEWSLVFLGGRFSHAVVKRPAAGDFRVQAEHGGSARPADPGDRLVRAATRILAAAPDRGLYARVDGCLTDGELRLVELEMLEPSLFLAHHPEAPARFAAAIRERLRAEGTAGRRATREVRHARS